MCILGYCDTDKQVADMSTKSFSDKAKWQKVGGLVGLIDFTNAKHLFTTSSVHHPSESVKNRSVAKPSVACVAIPSAKQCLRDIPSATSSRTSLPPDTAMSGKSYADGAKGAASSAAAMQKGAAAAIALKGKGAAKGSGKVSFSAEDFADDRQFPAATRNTPADQTTTDAELA